MSDIDGQEKAGAISKQAGIEQTLTYIYTKENVVTNGGVNRKIITSKYAEPVCVFVCTQRETGGRTRYCLTYERELHPQCQGGRNTRIKL